MQVHRVFHQHYVYVVDVLGRNSENAENPG